MGVIRADWNNSFSTAELVILAADTSPLAILLHLPLLWYVALPPPLVRCELLSDLTV
jgi:hypothetical protein